MSTTMSSASSLSGGRHVGDDVITPEVAERIVLYRAGEGSLFRKLYAEEYLFEDRGAPGWLARAAEKAREAELVQCGPDGQRGMPVTLTDAGRARYEELLARHAPAERGGARSGSRP